MKKTERETPLEIRHFVWSMDQTEQDREIDSLMEFVVNVLLWEETYESDNWRQLYVLSEIHWDRCMNRVVRFLERAGY